MRVQPSRSKQLTICRQISSYRIEDRGAQEEISRDLGDTACQDLKQLCIMPHLSKSPRRIRATEDQLNSSSSIYVNCRTQEVILDSLLLMNGSLFSAILEMKKPICLRVGMELELFG